MGQNKRVTICMIVSKSKNESMFSSGRPEKITFPFFPVQSHPSQTQSHVTSYLFCAYDRVCLFFCILALLARSLFYVSVSLVIKYRIPSNLAMYTSRPEISPFWEERELCGPITSFFDLLILSIQMDTFNQQVVVQLHYKKMHASMHWGVCLTGVDHVLTFLFIYYLAV